MLSSSPSFLFPLSAPKSSLRCSVSHGLQFKCLNGSLDVIKAICVLGVKYVLKHLAGWSHKKAHELQQSSKIDFTRHWGLAAPLLGWWLLV